MAHKQNKKTRQNGICFLHNYKYLPICHSAYFYSFLIYQLYSKHSHNFLQTQHFNYNMFDLNKMQFWGPEWWHNSRVFVLYTADPGQTTFNPPESQE